MSHDVNEDNARQAVVLLHISSLPGPFGIGEIGGSARAFVDAMQTMRLSVWQVLPLGPTGYGDSPYQSFSSFAGNELLIDIQALVDEGFLYARETQALSELPADRVDFGARQYRSITVLFNAWCDAVNYVLPATDDADSWQLVFCSHAELLPENAETHTARPHGCCLCNHRIIVKWNQEPAAAPLPDCHSGRTPADRA